jgi:N-acetylglutamate synthase-like GNAT family acetyltransferase
MMFTIEEVKDEDQKMAVVDEVLKDLPEWFGIPESTQAYIEGAKDLQVWAAYQESNLLGFVSLSYSSEDCAEIDCLGVKKLIKVEELGVNCLLL